MALPKGKISKARKHSRQANWKISAPSIVKCPRCQKMKLSHRVCKHCGASLDKQAKAAVKKDKKVAKKAKKEAETAPEAAEAEVSAKKPARKAKKAE